jgi:hypothetical protein
VHPFSAMLCDRRHESFSFLTRMHRTQTPAQTAHARNVLARSANLCDIRRKLSPSHMSDQNFWQMYFWLAQCDAFEEASADPSLSSSWAVMSGGSDGGDADVVSVSRNSPRESHVDAL